MTPPGTTRGQKISRPDLIGAYRSASSNTKRHERSSSPANVSGNSPLRRTSLEGEDWPAMVSVALACEVSEKISVETFTPDVSDSLRTDAAGYHTHESKA